MWVFLKTLANGIKEINDWRKKRRSKREAEGKKSNKRTGHNFRARALKYGVLVVIICWGLLPLIIAAFNKMEYLWIPALVGGITLVLNLADGIVKIPVVRYAAVSRLEELIGRVLTSGLGYVVPYVDKPLIVSAELQTRQINVEVFSFDNQVVIVEGSVQYFAAQNRLIVLIGVSDSALEHGLKNAIASEINKISEKVEARDFVKRKTELGMLINCILRLERPPHHHVNPAPPKLVDSERDFKIGETLKEWFDKLVFSSDKEKGENWKKLDPGELKNWEYPVTEEGDKWRLNILNFYALNTSKISLLLKLAKKQSEEDHSEIEITYGLNMVDYRLADATFKSEETQKSFEKKVQAKEKVGAAREIIDWKAEEMKRLIDLGLTPQEANVATDIAFGTAPERQVISLEGLGGGGSIPLININPSTRKGGEK